MKERTENHEVQVRRKIVARTALEREFQSLAIDHGPIRRILIMIVGEGIKSDLDIHFLAVQGERKHIRCAVQLHKLNDRLVHPIV